MTGPCQHCRREIQAAWGFHPDRRKPGIWACSRRCLDAAIERSGEMTMVYGELTENERSALWHALSVACSYLDKIGKTDLADHTEEELFTFGEAILVTYTEALQETCSKQPPF